MNRGVRWSLFLLLALALKGQWIDPKVFPSDSRALAQTEDKDLIQTVCPGHLEKGGKVDCGKNCPSSSGLDIGQHIFDWSLIRVTRGHFLSAASDDAVISTDGCESHSTNFGGSVLLTRRADKWRILWYKPGVQTELCHKVDLKSGREILICMGQFGGQGNVWTQLYMEDMLRPQGSLMSTESHVFEVYDNTVPCDSYDEDKSKASMLRHAVIEKVEFLAENSAGLTMSVEFRVGKRAMTAEAVEACSEEKNSAHPPRRSSFTPVMHHYHMDFIFDGHDFRPTPSTAALAKRLELP